MFDPKKVKRCAYCKRWEGDAQLRKGNTNGTVAFKDGVYGKCLRNQHPVQAASNGVALVKIMLLVLKRIDSFRRGCLPKHMAVEVTEKSRLIKPRLFYVPSRRT